MHGGRGSPARLVRIRDLKPPASAPALPAAAIHEPCPGWLTTRHEEKALLEGRLPAFLSLARAWAARRRPY